MPNFTYTPPWGLRNGLAMTIYTAARGERLIQQNLPPEPPYRPQIFIGAQGVPIFGLIAIPQQAHSTIVATYGITGSLENQWFLRLLGRKAFAQGYAIVLFDWRAHGETAQLSPTLTSDGLYEGEDFVRIAAAAKALGCPAPFWFTAYSLGGQLVLWAVKVAQTVSEWGGDLGIYDADIGGGAAICPALDSTRSLNYLNNSFIGQKLEQLITRQLKKVVFQIYQKYPDQIDLNALERVDDIISFDHELVIQRLGFNSVEAYYAATSGLYQLPNLRKPTLILYAADDPMFDPTLVPDLQAACAANPNVNLLLTAHGGHVSYLSNQACQRQMQDGDPWWAWNRLLDWISQQEIR
jgi:predicted alpha/beta-fold hydrolase